MRAIARRSLRFALVMFVLLALIPGGPALAGGSSISPTRLVLSKAAPTSSVVVTNTSQTPQRYSVSARAWDQTPENQLTLSDTSDVVFFPGSFTLESMRQQRIRVGVTAPAAAAEKTYRVIVSELPPLQSVIERNRLGLEFTTSFSVPIYVQPATPRYAADLGPVSVSRDELRFAVRNTGNVHFVAKTMKVSARGDGGQIMSTENAAWFVLQNNQRAFALPIPKGACGAVKSVSITLEADQTYLTRSIAPEHTCN
ncbi:MAG: molecular chaperone [Candidatus Velthaea sp.]